MTAYDTTLIGNCAFSLNTAQSGGLQIVTLVLRQGNAGGYLPSLPGGVKWAGGTAPTPNSSAGKIDVFTFRTTDGGTTWFGGN